MRRAKAKLTVSTFPFLAVLLCAMGSLIMLLMVFDQRAKRAARQRNMQQAVVQARAEEDRWKKAQAALDADATLQQEQERALRARGEKALGELEGQAKSLATSLESAATAALAEKGKAGDLRARVESISGQLEVGRRDLAALDARLDGTKRAALQRERERQDRKRLVGDAKRAVEAQRDSERVRLERLATELSGLEKALKQAEDHKDRKTQTFSIIPYKGKRGEDKRPLYVECSSQGLIFHPDRLTVDPASEKTRLLLQIEDRARAQNTLYVNAGLVAHPRPFLMLLVRPDGIENYYKFQVAVKGAALDFGYELIDQEWDLDFPQERQLADGNSPAGPGKTLAANTATGNPGAPGRFAGNPGGIPGQPGAIGTGGIPGFPAGPGGKNPGSGVRGMYSGNENPNGFSANSRGIPGFPGGSSSIPGLAGGNPNGGLPGASPGGNGPGPGFPGILPGGTGGMGGLPDGSGTSYLNPTGLSYAMFYDAPPVLTLYAQWIYRHQAVFSVSFALPNHPVLSAGNLSDPSAALLTDNVVKFSSRGESAVVLQLSQGFDSYDWYIDGIRNSSLWGSSRCVLAGNGKLILSALRSTFLVIVSKSGEYYSKEFWVMDVDK